MARRSSGLLLALGLCGTLVAPMCTSVANAQDWYADDTAATTSAAKQTVPSKEKILLLLKDGKIAEAEDGYLRWISLWEEDDAELTAAVASQALAEQYAKGEKNALVALAQAGDAKALSTLRDIVKGQAEANLLTDDQLAMALPALGLYGTRADAGLIAPLLISKKPTIAAAAADAMANLLGQGAYPYFHVALPECKPEQSFYLARTIVNLGMADQLNLRYLRQLNYPLEGIKERSAFMMAIAGNTAALPIITPLLDAKDPRFYPACLGALGNLPSAQVAAYVREGLQGNEAECQAALYSIGALPVDEVENTLADLVNDESKSLKIRLTALQQLTQRYTKTAQDAVRSIAFAQSDSVELQTAATLALAKTSAFADFGKRKTLYMRLLDGDENDKLAIRAVLLAIAQAQ